MSVFTGTPSLIRLILRRDRIKLPLWTLALTSMMAINVPPTIDVYGGTLEKQITYATTTASSIVSRIFNGPIHGPTIGEIVMNETFLFAAVGAAFMSTLAIVRHTRQNEETGRAELIRSAVTGGQSLLTAALVVTIGTNITLSALLALVFIANDLPIGGSIAAGAVIGCVGLIFTGVAAITAQLSESARGASGLAASVIGMAFLLRGVGDGLGTLTNHGTGVASAWPSWLSPLGWGQQMYVYTENNWWIFGLFVLFAIILIAIAFWLNAYRDVGLGILPARRGPAQASKRLLSPLGLAWRLQRGTLRGWAVAILVMGITIGAVSKEFEKLFSENEQIAEYLTALGGNGSINDILFSGMMALMSIALSGYIIQALLRMRAEEAAGRLEPILAAHVSRPRWMLSHIICAFAGATALVLLLGVSASTTYVLITGAPWFEVVRLTGAALAHVTAILVLGGFTVALFGLLPHAVMAVAWVAFAGCLFIGQFGAVIKLPGWAINLSPFSHVPAAPIEAVTPAPLLVLLAVASALTVAGLVFFRQRDMTTA
jgi:ABC-2 type transport system permease protein